MAKPGTVATAPGDQASTEAASEALSLVHSTFLIVGTKGPEGGPHYMVANWGTQASFDPWRYVIAIKNVARTLKNAKDAGAFTVNLLEASKKDVVKEILKTKGWNDHAADEGPTDAPRLPEAYAGFDCRVLDTIDVGGDHTLVVGEVVGGWKTKDAKPLMLGDMALSYSG